MNDICSFKPALMITVFLLMSIPFVSTHVNTEYEVRDLQRTDACFRLDANKWTASSVVGSSQWSQCQGVYLLGGYHILGGSGSQDGQFFSRTYNNIQSHTMVYFTFMMYAIDTWNGAQGERGFDLNAGGTTFNGWTNYDYSSFPSYDCGGSWKQAVINIYIYGRVNHIGGSFTFTITSKLDSASDNESWGIRDLSVIFATPATPPSVKMCAIGGLPIGNGLQCTSGLGDNYSPCHANCLSCFGPGADECYECKSGYGWSGTQCIQCHPTCTSCHGPSSTECGSCITGWLLYQNTTCVAAGNCDYPLAQTGCGSFCESPCSDPNDFAYWDQSCESYCNALPLQQITILSSKTCYYPCDTSAYLYWDGTCSATCNEPPLTRDTFKLRKFCEYDCAANEFLYWEGSCLPSCDPPLIQETRQGKQFCFDPCANSGDFLYWDGSCNSNCNPPLDQSTILSKKLCGYKCSASQSLRFDGTCIPSCDYPYIERIDHGKSFCDYPCPTGQYLYWDNLCYTSCNSPLTWIAVTGKKYCNYPCALNEYLNYDNNCIPSCDLPFTKKFVGDRNFCAYDCVAGEYLYENGTCISNCKAPFKIRPQGGINYCDAICPNRILFWNGTCINSCNPPMQYITNSSGTYCADPCFGTSNFYDEGSGQCRSTCDTALVIEKGIYLKCIYEPEIKPVKLVKLLHHIRYLNIKLPRSLQQMGSSHQMNFLSMTMITSHLEGARTWLLKAVSFEKIGQFIVFSGFLANFLEELVLMGIILSAGIIFKILEYGARVINSFKLQITFERLCILTTWNLFLIIFTSSIGDILFYTAIEFKNFNPASIQENLSFLVCLTMFVGVIVLIIFHIYLLNKISAFKAQALNTKTSTTLTSLPDYLLKWQSCQVLFRGFNDSSILGGAFYLIYQVRVALPMIIASFLPDNPIVQTSFYLAISIIIILFILIAKPINRKIDRINLILLEIIVFITNIAAFILTVFDGNEAWRFEIYKFFGDMVIAGNFAVNLLAGIFLVLKLYSAFKYAYKARKERSSEELGAWAQLFFIPLQQGGLGFEQVQLVTAFTVSRIKSANNKVMAIDLGGPVGPQMNESEFLQITEVHTPQVHDAQGNSIDQSFTSLTNVYAASPEKSPEKSLEKSIEKSPEKKPAFLAVPETISYRSEVSQFKKRKYNNSDLGSERNIDTITECGEDEQGLTQRLKNVENQEVSETSGPVKRRNKDLLPRIIAINPITPESEDLPTENLNL